MNVSFINIILICPFSKQMDKKGDDAKATTNPFVWIIFSHPFAVILLISLLAFVLPLVLLSIYPLLLGNDPEKVIAQLFK